MSPDTGPWWSPHPDEVVRGFAESAVCLANAARASLLRAPLHRRLWINDPDCLLLRPIDTELSPAQRRLAADMVAGLGCFLMVSATLLSSSRWWERWNTSPCPTSFSTWFAWRGWQSTWSIPSKPPRRSAGGCGPGGRLLFLTPNAWNYNTWLVRAVPNRYHEFFTPRLYGRQERDTYSVRYRLNTESKVERVMSAANLKKLRFLRNGDPSYISFNPTLFTMACGIETLLELPWLRRPRVHIIALYQR